MLNRYQKKSSGVKKRQPKKPSSDPIIVLFNKPYNTLCQFSGEQHDSTLADFIDIKNVYPAGRLDKDSEGLLILTNDGKLQHEISHPKRKMSKTYIVQVEGEITELALHKLSEGVQLRDGLTQPAVAKQVLIEEQLANLWDRHPPIRQRKNKPTSWISLTIQEGKNRQVRRMTAAVGFPTLRLIRQAIGNWSVDRLQPGEHQTIKLDNYRGK